MPEKISNSVKIGEVYEMRNERNQRRFVYRSNEGTERTVGLEFSVILMDEITRQRQIKRGDKDVLKTLCQM